MRLLQVVGHEGAPRLAVLDEAVVHVLTPHAGVATVLDLFEAVEERGLDATDWLPAARAAGAFTEVSLSELAAGTGALRMSLPLHPPEVWGAGVTYRRSADFREEGTGLYDGVYSAARPELFFKASAWRCVGPGGKIGRRRDSSFTASEPEVALVVSKSGRIFGYTLANDVSAWDIERENALYLPQSKIYNACFAFGPVIVTPDEIEDPYALELRCRIVRDGREVFSGAASTAQLRRRFPELIEWLLRSNEIKTGTVLSTGTGIIQPLDVGLEEGDVVTISCPAIGDLVNTVALV